jgi:hypothetical protein
VPFRPSSGKIWTCFTPTAAGATFMSLI